MKFSSLNVCDISKTFCPSCFMESARRATACGGQEMALLKEKKQFLEDHQGLRAEEEADKGWVSQLHRLVARSKSNCIAIIKPTLSSPYGSADAIISPARVEQLDGHAVLKKAHMSRARVSSNSSAPSEGSSEESASELSPNPRSFASGLSELGSPQAPDVPSDVPRHGKTSKEIELERIQQMYVSKTTCSWVITC
jgi:hypothetical protein